MTSRIRSVRLEDDIYNALKKMSERPYTPSWHIQEALRQYLAGKTPKKEVAPRKPKAEEDHEFEQIWELYERKGSKKTSKARFAKLGRKTRELIYNHLPAYLLSTPDKKYRKDFERYISNECWNDEVITNENSQSNTSGRPTKRDIANDQRERDAATIRQSLQQPHNQSNGVLELHGEDVRPGVGYSKGPNGQ